MKRRVLALLAFTLPAVLAACGGGNNGGSNSSPSTSGSSSSCPSPTTSGGGNGASLKIGSKAFAEEELLASMAQQVLQAHGFKIDNTFQAADAAIGTALQSGTIDMYWQYTGTELTNPSYLNLQAGSVPTDLTGAFNFVQQKDAARGLCWYADTPFTDTNGVAIKSSDSAKYGTTLGDFGTYLTKNPSTQVCIQSEFRTRPDGLLGLESKYGWPASAGYRDIQGTAEKSIAAGQCVAGEVFTTDSAIQANNLVVLKDDKNLFPPDNAGLVLRQDVAQKYPLIAGLMNPVGEKLTTDTMVKLNAMVEIQNQKVSDVAHTWLVQNGFLSS